MRMSDSAKVLYLIYSTFTVAEFILLALSKKMPVYDAVITTLGSVSTSGTLVPTEGISYYDSLYVELVVGFFCIMASVNFVLYHYAATERLSYFTKDPELRAYIVIIASAVAICTFGLVTVNGEPLTEALRNSFFQVASFTSTTGYTITPYLGWPAACQMILLTVMFIGGCAASTARLPEGHPCSCAAEDDCPRQRQKNTSSLCGCRKNRKSTIPAPVVSNITVFIFTFIGILLLSTLILSIQGLDLETSLTSSLGLLSNTGAAFGEAASPGTLLILPSCHQAVARLPYDSRQAGAVYDNNSVYEKLLGKKQIVKNR